MQDQVSPDFEVSGWVGFQDVYGNVRAEVAKWGKDALQIRVQWASKDVATANDIDANAAKPGFLNKNDVSHKTARGGDIEKGVNGIV